MKVNQFHGHMKNDRNIVIINITDQEVSQDKNKNSSFQKFRGYENFLQDYRLPTRI